MYVSCERYRNIATRVILWALAPVLALSLPAYAPGSALRLEGAAVGRGRVFVPNAVVATGDTTLTDQSDSASAVPQAAYTEVDLPDLDGSGTLTGTYCSTELTPNRVSSATNDFTDLDRDDSGFEEVETYWAITAAQRYIRDTLGIEGAGDYQVKVNCHASADDFSITRFEGDGTSRIEFGDGGVDDAEDAELIWQLYGYAVFHHQHPVTTAPQGRGIRAGFGIYSAASWSTLVPGASHFQVTTAEWDATAYSAGDKIHPWPYLHRVDGSGRYPHDLSLDLFGDAQIWAEALWDIAAALGRDEANRIILNSHFLMPPDADFLSGAEAVVESDRQLNDGANAAAIVAAFARHGIDLAAPRKFEVMAATPSTGEKGKTIDVVRVIGDQFVLGAAVTFGSGIEVVSASVVSPTEIDAKIQIAADAKSGPRKIVVTNPGGAKARAKRLFRVVKPQSNAGFARTDSEAADSASAGKGVRCSGQVPDVY